MPFTQVCAAFGSDERTRAVTQALLADGDRLDVRLPLARPRRPARVGEQLVHATPSDVERSVDAVRRAVAAVDE